MQQAEQKLQEKEAHSDFTSEDHAMIGRYSCIVVMAMSGTPQAKHWTGSLIIILLLNLLRAQWLQMQLLN